MVSGLWMVADRLGGWTGSALCSYAADRMGLPWALVGQATVLGGAVLMLLIYWIVRRSVSSA